MTRILLLLLLCSFVARAQQNDLKPIGYETLPTYVGRYGGWSGRIQYTYDGLDIRARQLEPYIVASANREAIQNYNAYLTSRHVGGWLIAGGLVTTLVGGIVMGSNGPNENGRFTKPFNCPTGMACFTAGGTFYGGQQVGTQPDPDRERVYNRGVVTALLGVIVAGIGWGMTTPGRRVRQAVQHYNRALKEQGISWQLQPYSTVSNSGIGVVAQF